MTPRPRKTVQIHRVQSDFRHSAATYRGFVGGRGAGKTWVGAYDLIRRARRGRTYLVGSPTAQMMRDTTLPTFKAIAQDLGVWAGGVMTPYPSVTLTTGAAVRFRTAEDPEKMRGPNLSGVWLDEASLMPVAAYHIAIASLRERGEQGYLAATFTPKGPSHWSHDVFNTGQPDTAIFKAPTRANPFLPANFADKLLAQYGETQFARQEVEGDFVQMEGAEFPAEWFDRPGFWFEQWPTSGVIAKALYLDPSKGRSDGTGDYQAFVLAALVQEPSATPGRVTNTIYLDAVLSREPVPDMVARGIRLCREFQPDQWDVEDNGTMGFMEPEVQRQLADAGVLQAWLPVWHSEPKVQRVRILGGYLSRGQIRIRATPGGRLLRAQLAEFPLGEFDDAPDAASGAVRRLELLTQG